MEEKKEPKVIRRLFVDFDKQRLHASIMLHMRRMRIPSNMIGTDLLKGVVFGILRHPDISIDEAVSKSVEASKFPGSEMTVEDGYEYIIEVLEVSSKEDLPEARTLEESREIVRKAANSFVAEIRKEFCYEITIKTLENELRGERYSIGYEIVKCMLFKKLYAPESTYECMLNYALRKVGKTIDEKELTLSDLFTYTAQFVEGENDAVKQKNFEKLLADLENQVYEEYPYEKVTLE